jgi:hypothetical protein
MNASNKIRIATPDMAGAVRFACSTVEAAVGISVEPELQEIEGRYLIVELRVDDPSNKNPTPSRIASAVDRSATSVEVLSAWQEPSPTVARPRDSDSVVTAPDPSMSPIAFRSLQDQLPTAKWQPGSSAWHLAVPCARAQQPTVIGISSRRGYSVRFTSLEVESLRNGLRHDH